MFYYRSTKVEQFYDTAMDLYFNKGVSHCPNVPRRSGPGRWDTFFGVAIMGMAVEYFVHVIIRVGDIGIVFAGIQ